MEIFTVFGLALFLFGVMVIISLLLNITFGRNGDEIFDCGIGFTIVMLILSAVLSSFLVHPESFGYEKIVSNNSVEQEIKK
jgi:Mn2+/Fe2+ NRAMP family transporter